MKYLFLILILFFVFCSENKLDSKKTENSEIFQNNSDTFKTSVIQLDTGWGYEISINGKKYIQQTIIPAISGRYTFGSVENSQKTANFVAKKMMNNIFPPSVSVEELDSLGVLNDAIKIEIKVE